MKLYKTTLIYSVFFLLIGFSFLSCKKQAEVSLEIKQEIIWKKHPEFNYGSASLITAKAFDDALILASSGFGSHISILKGTSIIEGFSVNFFERYPPAISRNLHVTPREYPNYISDTIIFFRSNYTPVSTPPYSSLALNVKGLGLGIKRVLYSINCGAFSNMVGNRVKFLMGCLLENNQNALLLLELEHTDKDFENPITLISKKIIPLSGTSHAVNDIRFIKGNFYVYRSVDFGLSSLRVSLNGDVRDLDAQLGYPTGHFFLYGQDTLCHFTQKNEIDISTDNGLTWRGYAQNLPSYNSFFSNIKDKTLMVSPYSQIINLDLKNLKYQVLDIKGIPQNLIKGVEYYNDTVYVATFGGGLYYKSYKDVLDDIKSKYE